MSVNRLRILMVTSELVPLAKVGGLGDMVSALAAELDRQGHDVRVVLPRYYSLDRADFERIEGPLGVPLGLGEEWCAVIATELAGSGVKVYALDHEGLFGRDGVYGTRAEPAFPDNVRRFAMLCRGALQVCKMLDWTPDVVHAHDWPAALAPVYLYTVEAQGPFERTGSLLTLHNLGHQGLFGERDFVHTGLPLGSLEGSGFRSGRDNINLLVAGALHADVLTTVSPTYAREIQTPAHGEGMDGLLRRRSGDLFGVLNGIDYEVWNPETDPLIPATFSVDDLSGKAAVKSALQEELGLEVTADVPLVGMVTRLVRQKGITELCAPAFGSLFSICRDMALQVVILGTGEAWLEKELQTLAAVLPNLRVVLKFDDRLAHLIEGGSDFFLMPSRYEPCGLSQMYALRYGTLPIVRRTGGLADTVESYDEETGAGTGFVFDELTPLSIYNSVGWAVWAWYNRKQHLAEMRRRGMELRFSWETSARRYAELYQWAKDRRIGQTMRIW